MLTVRPIQPSDADGLLSVWRETWPVTYRPTLGDAAVDAMLRSLDDEGVASLLPPETSAGFCALDGDRVVATAIHSVGRPVVYLWGFYVRPSHQRSGLGARVMTRLREAAGEAPVECRVLETSTGALRFYEAMGFATVGREDTEVMPGVTAACLVMRDRR